MTFQRVGRQGRGRSVAGGTETAMSDIEVARLRREAAQLRAKVLENEKTIEMLQEVRAMAIENVRDALVRAEAEGRADIAAMLRAALARAGTS